MQADLKKEKNDTPCAADSKSHGRVWGSHDLHIEQGENWHELNRKVHSQ